MTKKFSKNLLFILLAKFLLACEGTENAENFDLAQRQDKFIWAPESWNDICFFGPCDEETANTDLARIAVYGKSVGLVKYPGFTNYGCSSFLISDSHLATARHCSCNGWLSCNGFNGSAAARVEFGRWGSNYGSFATGTLVARYRLKNFVGVEATCANNVSATELKEWSCFWVGSAYTQEAGYRDISFYHCPAKPICGQNVLPGHLWGFSNTDRVDLGENDSFSLVSINTRYEEISQGITGVFNTLLSPNGKVLNANTEGANVTGPYYYCMSVTGADNYCGSSGGPAFTQGNSPFPYIAMGVVQGSNWKTYPTYVQNPASDVNCTTYPQQPTTWKYYDFISKIPGNVTAYYRMAINYTIPLLFGSFSNTISVGGSGGTQHVMLCGATNSVAAGIIGTTSANGYVGNFGIVCSPYDNPNEPHHLDSSSVRVGGSFGTSSWTSMDLNSYYNEILDNENNEPGVKHQSIKMCKKGYFLKGVELRSGAYVDRIEKVVCEKWDHTTSYSVGLETDNKIGTSAGGTYKIVTCPSNAFVIGIDIRSAWLTDGFLLRCRQ